MDEWNGMWVFMYVLSGNGRRGGLKKDVRVCRVGGGGCVKGLVFVGMGVIWEGVGMVRGRRGRRRVEEGSRRESCMVGWGRMNGWGKGVY